MPMVNNYNGNSSILISPIKYIINVSVGMSRDGDALPDPDELEQRLLSDMHKFGDTTDEEVWYMKLYSCENNKCCSIHLTRLLSFVRWQT